MNNLLTSQLYDEKTFYQTFLKDLEKCESELIIESPYITSERMVTFDGVFEKLLQKGVRIYIVTRSPKEHDENLEVQSEREITNFEYIGVQVFLIFGNHHRKLAIIDRRILWEGSLNILSQTKSREIMRRIEDKELAQEMLDFIKLEKFL